ncbi:hypothetical protein EVAR_95761_1 [Eumeta japonica]|uniref:Major facilitator superfamily (MFS) profile domain-containing protein n=1 Tax=Eumeta variegata TaxID=151549 RepID=A0A4C1UKM3_EUMVA|nr:hypothetical protein EVAR_95761_1 [Eumeta japonica]
MLADAVPARLNVALMMFFACWINYMLRVNMSVNIIAMVPGNSTSPAFLIYHMNKTDRAHKTTPGAAACAQSQRYLKIIVLFGLCKEVVEIRDSGGGFIHGKVTPQTRVNNRPYDVKVEELNAFQVNLDRTVRRTECTCKAGLSVRVRLPIEASNSIHLNLSHPEQTLYPLDAGPPTAHTVYMLPAPAVRNDHVTVPSVSIFDKNDAKAKSECEAIAANDSVNSHNASAGAGRPARQVRPQWHSAPFLVHTPEDAYTFDWTAQQQAYVLSGYFWGYAITCLAGGTAAERWGPRGVVFITTIVTSVLTLLSPPAAKLHYAVLVALRFVMGLCAGFLFPALHALLAHWAPPAEKGKFVSALLGGSIGTVVTWSLSGPLLENFGWDYAFYVPGLIGMVWCVVWWVLVYDSPTLHPRISEAEKAYILEAIGDKVQDQKSFPPFKSIFTSFPFLAMVILHYGNSWGLYFVMTAAPKFVSSALGFNLAAAGTVASLPYLARMIFSLIFGAIGDRIIKKNIVSTTFLRKFFCLFSHVLPGLLLIGLGYTGCAPVLSVALITFSMGCNGAATLTNLVNHQDLAPNFAGTLYGIANGIGNTAGFVTPLVTAHFTKDGNGFAEWRPVFMTGASLYIASAIYFMIFGTGVTQPWNYIQPSPEREKRINRNGASQNGSATHNGITTQNGVGAPNGDVTQNSTAAENGAATQNGGETQNGVAMQNGATGQNNAAAQNGSISQNPKENTVTVQIKT